MTRLFDNMPSSNYHFFGPREQAVVQVLKTFDGLTLHEIATRAGYQAASVSACIRNLRSANGYPIETRRTGSHEFRYYLLRSPRR